MADRFDATGGASATDVAGRERVLPGGRERDMDHYGFDAERFVRDVFRPRSFAVLGASDDPGRIGGRPIAFTKQRYLTAHARS